MMIIRRIVGVVVTCMMFSGVSVAQMGGNPPQKGGWVLAYEHDSAGQAVDGNFSTLITAFDDGGDFKIRFGGASGNDLIPCQHVSLVTDVGGNTHIACFMTTLGLLGGGGPPGPPQIRPVPFIGYLYQDTIGNSVTVRASVHGGGSQGNSILTAGAQWFVRIR